MKQKSPPRNAFYAQSGGVTAVINASACGVIETGRKHKGRIGKVYAGRNGILGALTEDLIDTGQESAAVIRALRHTPAGAFGSARYKLKKFEDNPAQYERLIEVFKAHDIGYFFYNGGGDSADTCLKVSQLAEKLGYPLQAIHVPKTVDNDLPITDCCPGFGSVAKYVAVSIREAGFDVASMARTSTKVFVLEVMGRHAGWIAAAGGLAARESRRCAAHHPVPGDPVRRGELPRPHEGVRGQVRLLRRGGLGGRAGTPRASSSPTPARATPSATPSSAASAPVVAQLVKDKLGYKYHWAVADYLQRAARHIASKVDVEQAYAVGKAAVEFALQGPQLGHADHRPHLATSPTGGRSAWRPLDKVANVEKMLPRDYITPDGFDITAKGRRYLAPLIKGEDYPPYKDGLPSTWC